MSRFFILFITLVFSISAQAQSKLSVGASAGSFSYDNGDSHGDSSVGSLFAQYGQLSNNFDIEFGFSNLGSYENDGLTTDLTALTVSLVGQWGDYHGIKPFAKVGYGYMRMTRSADFLGTEIETESTGDTLSAGLGLNYTNAQFSNVTLRLSYDIFYFQTSSLITGDDTSNNLGGISLGALYHF